MSVNLFADEIPTLAKLKECFKYVLENASNKIKVSFQKSENISWSWSQDQNENVISKPTRNLRNGKQEIMEAKKNDLVKLLMTMKEKVVESEKTHPKVLEKTETPKETIKLLNKKRGEFKADETLIERIKDLEN